MPRHLIASSMAMMMTNDDRAEKPDPPSEPHLQHPEQFKKFKALGFKVAFNITYNGQEFCAYMIGLEKMGVLSREQIRGIAMGKYQVVPKPGFILKEKLN